MPDPRPTADICIMVLAVVTAWSGVLIRAVGIERAHLGVGWVNR